jgi:hypothetical protein
MVEITEQFVIVGVPATVEVTPKYSPAAMLDEVNEVIESPPVPAVPVATSELGVVEAIPPYTPNAKVLVPAVWSAHTIFWNACWLGKRMRNGDALPVLLATENEPRVEEARVEETVRFAPEVARYAPIPSPMVGVAPPVEVMGDEVAIEVTGAVPFEVEVISPLWL